MNKTSKLLFCVPPIHYTHFGPDSMPSVVHTLRPHVELSGLLHEVYMSAIASFGGKFLLAVRNIQSAGSWSLQPTAIIFKFEVVLQQVWGASPPKVRKLVWHQCQSKIGMVLSWCDHMVRKQTEGKFLTFSIPPVNLYLRRASNWTTRFFGRFRPVNLLWHVNFKAQWRQWASDGRHGIENHCGFVQEENGKAYAKNLHDNLRNPTSSAGWMQLIPRYPLKDKLK